MVLEGSCDGRGWVVTPKLLLQSPEYIQHVPSCHSYQAEGVTVKRFTPVTATFKCPVVAWKLVDGVSRLRTYDSLRCVAECRSQCYSYQLDYISCVPVSAPQWVLCVHWPPNWVYLIPNFLL